MVKTKLVKGSKFQTKVKSDIFGRFGKASECPFCHAKEYYYISSKPVHSELVLIKYACLACGTEEHEPLD